MSNVTFITHLRYDHEDRIKNFQAILDYYSNNIPDSKFIVVEDDVEHNTNFDKIKWPKGTSYFLIKNEGFYHRTRALNYGAKKAKTEIIVSLDTDCLVSRDSFNMCTNAILNENVSIAWPYNGYVIDVTPHLYTEFISGDKDFIFFTKKIDQINELKLGNTFEHGYVRCTNKQGQLGVGGIVMFSKNHFLKFGGYNEKFIAWGGEDNELEQRVNTLNYKKFRDTDLNSILIHLPHRNVTRNTHPYYHANAQELIKIEKMSKEDLKKYISTSEYFIKND